MKKSVIIVAALLFVTRLFAVTEEEAMEYFKRCILELDPIEGFYSVEYRGNGHAVFGDAWSQFSQTTLLRDMYIVKMNEQRDGRYLVCVGNTAEQNWDYYWVLENIGTTSAYKFYMLNKNNEIVQSCQVVLNNGINFTASLSNLRASGSGNITAGGGGEFQINFIKSFPTNEMYKAAIQAELSKNYNYSSGTAFALKDGYFVTNYHVYDDNKYALVKGFDNRTLRAYFVAGDEKNDLAVFQIRDNQFAGFNNIPYDISAQTADIGEEVWTIGYPLTLYLGDEAKYTKGEISALSGSSGEGDNIVTNDSRFYQITTPITQGNSGGPLFDESGSIIGITSSGWSSLNNVNYALKSKSLLTLLERAGLHHVIPTDNSIREFKQKDRIKMVKPFVFRVICYNNKDVEAELFQDVSELIKQDSIVPEQHSGQFEQCDTILTMDEKTIFVKILNISGNAIMYKDLSKQDERVQAIDTSDIQVIIFANGVRQTYHDLKHGTLSADTFEKKETTLLSLQGNTYYYGNKELSKKEYIDIIKTCDAAWDRYNTKMPKVGIAIFSIGTVSLIGGVIYHACSPRNHGIFSGIRTADQKAANWIMAFGGSVLVSGIVITIIGDSKKRTAYQEYNNDVLNRKRMNDNRPDRFINLQVCQNGIGISFRF